MFANGNNNYSLSDIAAVTNGNDGMFGGANSWWIILLFIFMLFGWGGNRGGYGNDGGTNVVAIPYGGMGNGIGASIASDVQRGFDQSAIINGIGNIQTGMNNGFSNAEVSRCNAQANLLATLSNNQMGLYQTLNANQLANLQTANALQAQLAQCCCDNRAATQDVKYTIVTENCADRAAITSGVRDIIDNQNSLVQGLMDKLCQLELDGIRQNYENRILTMQTQNDQLRADNVALRGDISQANQTAAIENAVNRMINGCGCGNNNFGCCGN